MSKPIKDSTIITIKDPKGGPYKAAIQKIREFGYNPIAVTQLMLENCFAFETKEEAKDAYEHLERNKAGKWLGLMTGWWYCKESFYQTLDEHADLGPFTVYDLKNKTN